MLSFFSELLGIPYPWQNYDQIIVRDYVSGAMENTTAVVFGEFAQRKKRDLIDDNNDHVVAHELIHHWFGNWVRLNSCSILILIEGFANIIKNFGTNNNFGDKKGKPKYSIEK